jgi:hypothetical protein
MTTVARHVISANGLTDAIYCSDGGEPYRESAPRSDDIAG